VRRLEDVQKRLLEKVEGFQKRMDAKPEPKPEAASQPAATP